MRLPQVLACVPLALTLVTAAAVPAAANSCATARAQSGRNPSFAQVNAAMDAAAQRRRVPPPLLKAIAWKESGWGQFWPTGRAKVSGDCGVGIMQITGGAWDYRRLGADYAYNIDAGAQALAAKMSQSSANVPPVVGSDERRVIENWYRATYRYNGAGYRAEQYADAVFGLVVTPPESLRPYTPPVRVTNPKNVVRGYRPTSAHAYVARLDGRWASTIGTFRGAVTRGDLLPLYPTLTPGSTLEGGQRAPATYAVRNLGWLPWDPAQVGVSTFPAGRASALVDGTWRSRTTAAHVPRSVGTGQVAQIPFAVRAAAVAASRSVTEQFALSYGGRPLASGVATSRWTLHPGLAPAAEITAAPIYALEDGGSPAATVQLRAADPTPGSGLNRIELTSRQVCDGCPWSPVIRVAPTAITARVPLPSSGSHELRVRAVDNAGNFGAWSALRQVFVPRDDASEQVRFDSAWSASATSEPGPWLGTVHSTVDPGATVQTTAEATRLAVIGATGPDLADLEVWVDGVLHAVVVPRSDSLTQRRVLWETTVAPGQHHLMVRVAGSSLTAATSQPRGAYIDALVAA